MHTRRPTKSAIQSPKLPKVLEEPTTAPKLHDQAEITQLKLWSQDFTGQRAADLKFDQIHFRHTRLGDTFWQTPKLVDIRGDGCDLANAQWPNALLRRNEWRDCGMVGFKLIEAHLQDTLFRGCLAQFAQFRFATFKIVQFEDCDLSQADFYGADLTGVRFIRCNLSQVEFSHAKLRGADLRTCQVADIRTGVAELQGAIVDPIQAAYLAGLLGLVIKHEDEE